MFLGECVSNQGDARGHYNLTAPPPVHSNSLHVVTRRVERNRAKQTLEENAKKVEQAKVDLGKSYMTLIMGLGNAHCHHSLQGR